MPAAPTIHPAWQAMQHALRPHQGVIARAFPRTIASIKAAYPHEAIAAALYFQAFGHARTIARASWQPEHAAPFSLSLAQVFEAGRVHGLSGIRKATSQPTVSDLALAWAADHAADLVDGVSADQEAQIEAIIARGIAGRLSPRQVQRALADIIGLNDRQATALLNYRQSLVDQAVEDDKVESLASSYADRLLKQRAETIERTATMRAANEGQEAGWGQARSQGLIPPATMKRLIVSPGACPICEALAEGGPIDLDDDFGDDGPPPIHPNCLCTEALDYAEAAAA